MDLSGKKAVVTGGASGIGLGIARALVSKGAQVIIVDLNQAEVDEAAAGLGASASGKACDVRSLDAMKALAAECGEVDVLFNNAGVGGNVSVLDLDEATSRWIMDVNYFGVMNGFAAFAPALAARGTKAAICTTASEHGLGFAHGGMFAYTASKHAVMGMVNVLRGEMPEHVTLSLACPGLVHTNMSDAAKHGPHGLPPEEELAMARKVMAAGRAADEISRLIVEGVEAGNFYIMTHPHAIRFARERYEEIAAAFDAQAPYTEESEAFDVMNVAMKALSGEG